MPSGTSHIGRKNKVTIADEELDCRIPGRGVFSVKSVTPIKDSGVSVLRPCSSRFIDESRNFLPVKAPISEAVGRDETALLAQLLRHRVRELNGTGPIRYRNPDVGGTGGI